MPCLPETCQKCPWVELNLRKIFKRVALVKYSELGQCFSSFSPLFLPLSRAALPYDSFLSPASFCQHVLFAVWFAIFPHDIPIGMCLIKHTWLNPK